MKEFRHSALRDSRGECKVVGKSFVCVPEIREEEWNTRFLEHMSAPKNLIFSGDLSPDNLSAKLVNSLPKQLPLSDEDWNTALALIKNSESLQTVPRRPAKRVNSRADLLRSVEEQMAAFDINQHKFAIQTPWGPQQLTGLAGTGKTVVLAQKAAYMHVRFPDWKIVFTFYTRALYEQVESLIEKFVQDFSRGEMKSPNWDNLHVWHSWGTRQKTGLYRELCELTGHRFQGYTEASRGFGISNSGKVLDELCKELLEQESIPELFDAILIDEGQDFYQHYYKLCYAALTQPKRIIWGYDVMQSLDNLEVPNPERLFGYDEHGQPIVNLDGVYPGDIDKEITLLHCYRNPRPVLIAAHAFGLGLRHKGGAVQFIDSVEGWKTIGYAVKNYDKEKLSQGDTVTLFRPKEYSPHYLEDLVGYEHLVTWEVFPDRDSELQWIANDIEKNITEEELRPEEIAVISLGGKNASADVETLRKCLSAKKIKTVKLIGEGSFDYFKSEGAVTITNVFRAKGNEASLVYVFGFENVGGTYDIGIKRNRAFTAMTRTKGWLCLTGVGNIASELFQEIQEILAVPGTITFEAPDMTKIQRNLETQEKARRKKKAHRTEKSIEKLISDLIDVDLDDLPADKLAKLQQLIERKKKS